MNKNLSLPSLCRKLTEYGSFLVLVHRSPDPDALGSALAFKRLMDVCGKRTEIICSDKAPERLRFLTATEDLSLERLSNFVPDCKISVDVADPALLGDYQYLAESLDICIDHHARRSLAAKYNYFDSEASACGEIIYLMAKQFEKMKLCSLDQISATFLYSAISGDTGCFAYSNVTPRTHRIAADLLSYGVNTAEINERLHKRSTKEQQLLKAHLISKMKFFSCDKVACVYIDDQTRRTFHMEDKDPGDIVNIPRELDGVEIAFSVKQDTEDMNKFKISLRTRSADASAIALKFGGGGHVRASGCTVKADNIEQCIAAVSGACAQELENV